MHDIFGNPGLRRGRLAETASGGATGTTGTVREYIWLPETEIAPTASSRTTIDRPLAVVANVNTVAPQTWWVSVDHLNRPVRMTTAAKASVWDAVWQPWGGVHSITGSASLDARFPGQWFQAETGLHYNWHRSYDPALGRYTQPDPLGFVDGPSVFGYGRGSPQRYVDRDGRFVWVLPFIPQISIVLADLAVPAAILAGIILSSDVNPNIQQEHIKTKQGDAQDWVKLVPPNPGGYSCRYIMVFPIDQCVKGICPAATHGRGWGDNLSEAMKQARQEALSKIPAGCGHQHHGQMWCRKDGGPPFFVRQ